MKSTKLNIQNIVGSKFPWTLLVDAVALINYTPATLVGQTVAGKVITATMRVLLTAQTTTLENGIYINGARAEDMAVGESAYGKIIYDTNLRTIWYSTAVDGDVIGTNTVTFVKPEIWQLRDFNNNTPTTNQALVYTGSVWQNSNIANSVFGRTGAITAQSGDYNISQITNSSTLASTANVSITSPTNGQILSYNGSQWVNTTSSGGNVTSVFGRTGAVVATEGDYSLTQLSDVLITSPTTRQFLAYNGAGQWINYKLSFRCMMQFNTFTNLVNNSYFLSVGMNASYNIARIPCPDGNGIIIDSFYVKYNAGGGIGTSRTITLHKNNAATALTATANNNTIALAGGAVPITLATTDDFALRYTSTGTPTATTAVVCISYYSLTPVIVI